LKSYFGSGNGTFGSGIASGLTSSRQLADFNRDGILDSIGTSGSNALVNLGRGDGTFADAASIAFGGFIYTLKVADLNADGVSDILVNANGTMQGRYGSADGTFGASNTFGTVVLPFASNLSIGDFNGDGTADYLVSTNASSGFRIGLANSEQVTSMQRLNLTTRAEALGSLSVIDATLARVSKELGAIGSTQSRLAVALNTLSSSKENYDAASARITNIDIANESAALVQTRTLKEIATAILAQANQAPALALQLLE
jgi:flagellin